MVSWTTDNFSHNMWNMLIVDQNRGYLLDKFGISLFVQWNVLTKFDCVCLNWWPVAWWFCVGKVLFGVIIDDDLKTGLNVLIIWSGVGNYPSWCSTTSRANNKIYYSIFKCFYLKKYISVCQFIAFVSIRRLLLHLSRFFGIFNSKYYHFFLNIYFFVNSFISVFFAKRIKNVGCGARQRNRTYLSLFVRPSDQRSLCLFVCLYVRWSVCRYRVCLYVWITFITAQGERLGDTTRRETSLD